jgi:predicted  nucleic acid-binding Zn-ribbon protein
MEPMRSLHDLLDLQDVDIQIDRLIDRRQSLPELDDYRVAHEATIKITAERDQTSARLRETALAIDKTSGELEITQQKASAEEMRLYAGGLSARDADYLRREVELLRGRVSSMEEEILELMEVREEIESELARLESELERESDHKAELESGIREAWRLIDAEIAVKERRKSEIVPLVDEDLMGLYETLRETHDDRVVGALINGVCGACHLILSSAEQNEARRQDPPRCVHCNAILVP